MPAGLMYMSSETEKKRKRDGRPEEEQGRSGGGAAGDTVMAEMKAHLMRMENRVDELDSKCKSLEVRCESLERSVQILKKDTKWEYSAPSIPRSHWMIDRGFDEDYIREMENFLRRIKYETCELRTGACSEHIYLGGICILGGWKGF